MSKLDRERLVVVGLKLMPALAMTTLVVGALALPATGVSSRPDEAVPSICCGGDGQDENRRPDTPAEQARARAKLAIAEAANAFRNGEGSRAEYDAAVRAYEAAYPDAAPFRPLER